ncbi:proline racemase family protein [Salinithrix halophila]|uniref:Proline racemase family protein n=1 Tax=Salinithrix halophila TaxID=1485204 RepID=A0ABV8JL22_9BACL
MQFQRLLTTIDAHAAGEPLRLITGGFQEFNRDTIDIARKLLLMEPRGHHGMRGCVIKQATSADSDFSVCFIDHEEVQDTDVHGIIAMVTTVLETGLFPVTGEIPRIVIDSPMGKIVAHARCRGVEVESVSFENDVAFVWASDVPITLDHRTVTVDIAYGGAFYALVKARDLGVKVEINQLPSLQEWGRRIRAQIEDEMTIRHPLQKETSRICGVVISDEPHEKDAHLYSVTIQSNGQVLRSPGEGGTCALLATLFQRERIKQGEKLIHESMIGTQLQGMVSRTQPIASYQGVVPCIKGRAFITGMHQFVLDPDDPLSEGFLLG